jgi:hypothetical protein
MSLLASCFVCYMSYSLTVMMDAASYSEMSVYLQWTRQCYSPEAGVPFLCSCTFVHASTRLNALNLHVHSRQTLTRAQSRLSYNMQKLSFFFPIDVFFFSSEQLDIVVLYHIRDMYAVS